MHVEDEGRGQIGLDDAGEQCARDERLAGAALAEDAGRAFDKPRQIEVDLDVVHLEGGADVEVGGVLGAEDTLDVLG